MGNFEDLYMPYPDPEDESEFTDDPSPEELQQAYDDMQREFEALTLKMARANGISNQARPQPEPHPDTQNQEIQMGQGDETGSRSRQAKSCQEKFLPYDTMFKLSERSQSGMENSPTPRDVVCVNCRTGRSLWEILKSSRFDYCPVCKVSSAEYWKDKPHRRVEDAQTG